MNRNDDCDATLAPIRADGRLALVVSQGAIDAYRWSTGERPMISGGHALLAQGSELDAAQITP